MAVAVKSTDAEAGGDWRPFWKTWRDHFVRGLAVIMLVLGLLAWAEIIGAFSVQGRDFATLSVHLQSETVFFAVANLVAAVGLWLGAAWGGVTWLFASFARILVHTASTQFFGWTPISTTIQVVAIIAYVVLMIMAEREDRARKIQDRRSRKAARNTAGSAN